MVIKIVINLRGKKYVMVVTDVVIVLVSVLASLIDHHQSSPCSW